MLAIRVFHQGPNFSPLQRKRKQYALLFHVLEELQRAPEDTLVADTVGDAPGTATAMEVE